MKKNYTMVFAVVAILIVLCAFWGCDSGGDGDDSNSSPSVIYINNAADWAKIGTSSGYPLNGNYELTADITLPSGWTPIAAPFTGTFNGGGRSITINSFPSAGVDISSAFGPDWGVYGDYLIARGLFAYTENATIKNLDITVNLGSPFVITPTEADQVQLFGTVAAAAINTAFTNVNFSGGGLDVDASSVDELKLGGIAGWLGGSSITGCSMSGDVKVSGGDENQVGGLAGRAEGGSNGSITGSSVSGNVKVTGGDENEVGGLVGSIDGNPIVGSSVSGNVEISNGGDENEAGGLVGVSRMNAYIVNNSVSGNVRAESSASGSEVKVGGLAGTFEAKEEECLAVIRKSYSTGTVSAISTASTGSATSGGIVGRVHDNNGISNENIEITDCYSTGNISAGGGTGTWVYSGGIAGICDIMDDTITIARCYASGTISATGSGSNKYAGGIAGSAFAGSGATGSITGCAALGAVSYEGSATAKRIAGSVTGSGFSLSSNIADEDIEINGAKVLDGAANNVNGLNKTSAELANSATYTGWDFTDVWKMEGGPLRPVLK